MHGINGVMHGGVESRCQPHAVYDAPPAYSALSLILGGRCCVAPGFCPLPCHIIHVCYRYAPRFSLPPYAYGGAGWLGVGLHISYGGLYKEEIIEPTLYILKVSLPAVIS